MEPRARALIVAALMIAPLALFDTGGHALVVDELESGPVVDLVFDRAGTRTANLSVPTPFTPLSATLNVSGHPGDGVPEAYPENVTLDVGGDGDIEWGFDGKGHGPMGMQDRFSDGDPTLGLQVDGAVEGTGEILLPANATVEDASLVVEGLPSPEVNGSETATGQDLDPAANVSETVEGPTSRHAALEAMVSLSDVVGLERALDIDQDAINDSRFMDLGHLIAQSFVLNRTDPRQTSARLYAVEVFVLHSDPADRGLDLAIYNSSPTGDPVPTGQPIVNRTLMIEDINSSAYTTFEFEPAPLLETDTVYVMVLRDRFTAALNGVYDIGYHRTAVGVEGSAYPEDRCMMQGSVNYGQTWSVEEESDLRFRTHVDRAYDMNQIALDDVLVDGRSPTDIEGYNISYEFQEPTVNSSGWTFEVHNDHRDRILYDLSAWIRYQGQPRDIGLDLLADGSIEHTITGFLDHGVPITDLAPDVQEALDHRSDGAVTDGHGNPMVGVPVRLTARGNGTVNLGDLDIRYNHTFAVDPSVLLAEMEGQGAGNNGTGSVTVPLVVSTGSPGTVRLSGLHLNIDAPPVFDPSAMPGLSMVEEEPDADLLDLATVFEDEDPDDDLIFGITDPTAPGVVDIEAHVHIRDRSHLMVNATDLVNWSGNISLVLWAEDGEGQRGHSPPVDIRVRDMNDRPVITSTPPAEVEAGDEYLYEVEVEDSDDAPSSLNITLTRGPEGMIPETDGNGTLSLVWVPEADDLGDHNISLRVSDGRLAQVQNFTVTVLSPGGSGPPVIPDLEDRLALVGTPLEVQVMGQADGPEVEYRLVEGPGNASINRTTGLIRWTPTEVGDYEIGVFLTDGYRNAMDSFTVTVLSSTSLSVVIHDVGDGDRISRDHIFTGRVQSQGTAVEVVEYSLDDGEWDRARLIGNVTWTCSPSLSVLDGGKHRISVRARDDLNRTARTDLDFTLGSGDAGSEGGTLSGVTEDGTLSYILLVVAVVAAIVAGIAVSRRRSARGGPAPLEGSDPAATGATGATAASEETLPGSTNREIRSAFLVYHDGRLITYASRSEIEDLDATLQVIKDFVKASFRGDVGRLDSLRYENMNVILERGTQMYLVVITPREELTSTRAHMRRFLHDVHERYRHVLKVWDGKYKKVKGVSAMLDDLVHNRWAPGRTGSRGEDDGPDGPGGPGTDDEGTGAGEGDIDDGGGGEGDGGEGDGGEGDGGEGDGDPPGKADRSRRWDDSPDLDDKSVSKVERRKALQDKRVRGEITEEEFRRLSKRIE